MIIQDRMCDDNILPLQNLRPGDWADVEQIVGDANLVGRMAELGLRAGSRVQLLRDGSPCLIQVGGSRLCVRGEAFIMILVRPIAEGG